MSIDVKRLRRAAIDPKRDPYPGHVLLTPESVLVTNGHLLVCRGALRTLDDLAAALPAGQEVGHTPGLVALRRVVHRRTSEPATVVRYTDPVDAATAALSTEYRKGCVLIAEEQLAAAEACFADAPEGRRTTARAQVEDARRAVRAAATMYLPGEHAWVFAGLYPDERVYVDRNLMRRAMRALDVRQALVASAGTHDPVVVYAPTGIALVMPCRL